MADTRFLNHADEDRGRNGVYVFHCGEVKILIGFLCKGTVCNVGFRSYDPCGSIIIVVISCHVI